MERQLSDLETMEVKKPVKLKAKVKNCQLIVRVKLPRGKAINDHELDLFARKYIRGFLKARKIKNGLVEYTGPAGISLAERLKKPISKYDFLFIMEQVADTTQKLRHNGLDIRHVVWEKDNAFINEVTKEVQFMYLPLTAAAEKADVIAFIESIIYAALPEPDQNSDYISQFVYFIKGLKEFNAEKVEQYIARVDKSVVNTIKKHNVGQSGRMNGSPQNYFDHYVKKGATDEEATGLLAEEEATGLLAEEEATGLLAENEEETALLTEVAAAKHFPCLDRVVTRETIYINKPVFRLGKGRSYVDYFIDNNAAVSRSHADIVTRGSRHFVIDLNSKNRTYINDQALPVQSEVEIFDGDRLKLANEEFVFHV